MISQALHTTGDLFHRVGWNEVIDLLVVSVIIYQLLKLVRGTQAVQLIAGLVLLAMLGLAANYLHLLLLTWIFQNAASFVVIAVIVLFQPELRRALDQVGRLSHLGRSFTGFHPQAFTSSVMEAIRAAELLSGQRVGALIAFEREVGLEDYAATGVRINGELSAEFLQSIFFTNSPLHDGAVIIRGNRILAAGCLLPMPEERVRERFGTRHRAALGLSRASDALVIVVSEETGVISLVENGEMTRNLDSAVLRRRLVGGLTDQRSTGGRPLLGFRFR